MPRGEPRENEMTTIAMAVPSAQRTERHFYLGMAFAIGATVLIGFARTVFLRPWFHEYARMHAPAEPWFYIHGVLFLSWIALFVTQASLISAGNVALHRKLGSIGAFLVPVMVFFGTVGALIAARRPTGFFDVADPPLQFLAKPLLDMLEFSVLAGCAIAWRRIPQTHKRLMLLATIALLEAVIVRWPIDFVSSGPDVAFMLKMLFVVPLVVWDFRTLGRLHPVTLWGGLFVVAAWPAYYAISDTQVWLAFARWSTGLLA
jgi:hypothetical protein